MSRGLNEKERLVLKLIFSGHDTLSSIVDFLGIITPDAVEIIERLEIWGLLTRVGTISTEYLRYQITPKGKDSLDLSEKEKTLIDKYGISEEDFKILKSAKDLGVSQNNSGRIYEDTGFTGMQIACCVENLEKRGYVKQRGVIRRYLDITAEGINVLANS